MTCSDRGVRRPAWAPVGRRLRVYYPVFPPLVDADKNVAARKLFIQGPVLVTPNRNFGHLEPRAYHSVGSEDNFG